MIKANTVMKSCTNGAMKLDGSVLIDVPKQLKPLAKIVLTQELYQILSSLDKIDPEIILDALSPYMEDVQNGSREN